MDALIPRADLFGDPDHTSVSISPDGQWLAFLAPINGALELFLQSVDALEVPAKALTQQHGVRDYHWMPDSLTLVFVSDAEGDENWQVRAITVDGAQTTLVALPEVQARLLQPSPRHPRTVLLGLNDRDPRFHDLVTIDLDSGKRSLILQNDQFTSIGVDWEFKPRFARRTNDAGGTEIFARKGDEWQLDSALDLADSLTTAPVCCTADGRRWYWIDSRGRNTAALVAIDADGTRTVLAEDEDADVTQWWAHPATGVVQLAVSTRIGPNPHVLDDLLQTALDRLPEREGMFRLVDRSHDDQRWVVLWERSDGPSTYALFEPASGTLTDLFVQRKGLVGLPLVRQEGVSIESRDGWSMVGYLHRPNAQGPRPMVLKVHGGPWARDSPKYDAYAQLLANRGYAVLAVNFRGSTGFGKAFLNAGDREWSGKMHDDLIDAVNWAIDEGITTRGQVAIMGGSYGGYATLVGLTFTPEIFACGIDIVGPSNLLTLLGSIPPYWAPLKSLLLARVGDDQTEEGRAELWARSPLSRVDKLSKPLLIAQGANDPRVKVAESEQIVSALRERNIPVRYALFPDEGHGFVRETNRLAFVALAEAFLAEHLGGRAEPIGTAVDASTAILT
ncbi:MAG: S9 family peptidase [Myxococcota bacterium]